MILQLQAFHYNQHLRIPDVPPSHSFHLAWEKHLNVWFLNTFPFVCVNCSKLKNGVFTSVLRLRKYVQVLFLPIMRRAGGRPSSRPALLCSIGLWSRSQPSMPLTWSVSLSVSVQVIADLLLPEPVFPFAESGNWLNNTLLCHFLQKLRSPWRFHIKHAHDIRPFKDRLTLKFFAKLQDMLFRFSCKSIVNIRF